MASSLGASPVQWIPTSDPAETLTISQAKSDAFPSSDISQRSMIDLGKGWRLWYDTYQLLLPVQGASIAFEALLQEVVDRASEGWSGQDPQYHVLVTKDYLDLEFVSRDPIPWPYVAHISIQLLSASRKGFNGLFNMRFLHAAAGIEIFVQLRAHFVAAAA